MRPRPSESVGRVVHVPETARIPGRILPVVAVTGPRLVADHRDQVHVVLGSRVEHVVEGLPVDLVRVDVGGDHPWKAQKRTSESGRSEAKNASIWAVVAMPPQPALVPQSVASW